MRSRPSSWNKTLTKLGFRRNKNKTGRRGGPSQRRLKFENLELRQLLSADPVVDTFEDVVSTTDGVTSLREAIDEVASAGGGTITFDPSLAGSKIEITTGSLSITNSDPVVIDGEDYDITIDALIDDANEDRVFTIGSLADVTIKNVTITGGKTSASANTHDGAGIFSNGDLHLENVTVTGNDSRRSGGGLFATNGSATIINSTFDSNIADYGGAARFDTANIDSVEISGSTFSNNEARGSGGALAIVGDNSATMGDVSIVNSTFSANDATGYIGGALNVQNHAANSVEIINSTITLNTADDFGGGIAANGTGHVTLKNTIVADNSLITGTITHTNDIWGTLESSSDYNLLGPLETGQPGSNNYALGASEPLDLSVLGDYGGPTKTHVPLSTSPAINNGDSTLAVDANDNPLIWDQRDVGFLRVSNGGIDIGAVESDAVPLAPTNPTATAIANGGFELAWDQLTAAPDKVEIVFSNDGLAPIGRMFEAVFAVDGNAKTITARTYDKQYIHFRTVKMIDGQERQSEWTVLSMSNNSFSGPVILQHVSNDSLQFDERAIPVTASASVDGSVSVTLSWPDEYDLSFDKENILYTISRRLRDGGGDWVQITSGSAATIGTKYVDDAAALVGGEIYDYHVRRVDNRSVNVLGYTLDDAEGYVAVAAEATETIHEQRGSVLVLVDDQLAAPLAFELARFEQDLIGDGWNVIREDVDVASMSDTIVDAATVKSIINSHYQASGVDLDSVILLGDFPVVKSGELAPDGHYPNGFPIGRAIEADSFYADLVFPASGDPWVDDVDVFGEPVEDGFFDIDYVPDDGDGAPLEVAVGRIDMTGLHADFTESATEYTRQYLDRDHAYRHGTFIPAPAVLVQDGGDGKEGSRPAAIRNFTSFVGEENLDFDVFRRVFSGSKTYQWGHASGSGIHVNDTFTPMRLTGQGFEFPSVFNDIMSSSSLEWSRPGSPLRTILAADGIGLTTTWGNDGNFHYHHMGVGATIGESLLVTQNEDELFFVDEGLFPAVVGAEVYTALMGDPTLRLHIVAPASDLIATDGGSNTAMLNWTASLLSSDPSFQGYHVYRRLTGSDDSFTRINGSQPVLVPSYADEDNATFGTYEYMVRTVKLEETPSGSYYNLSQGAFSHGLTIAAINVGGAELSGFDDADTSASPSPFLASTTGSQTFLSTTAVSGQFGTARVGEGQWRFSGLEEGAIFEVRLHFAEIDPNVIAIDDRVFDIDVNGAVVRDDFDIADQAGGVNIGITETISVTVGASGEIVIDLIAQSGLPPLLSGLEIIAV